ncbi:MAG: hypothetical protein AB1457_02145 [Chloroflexota bacterium]
MSQKSLRFIILFAVILSGLPFLAGSLFQNDDYLYTGLLLNPIDGFSYLAKMQIGMRGEWQFHLPYTANEGHGAFLFMFYILLGHIARIFSIEPIIVFHLARLAAGFVLCWGIVSFLRSIRVKWIEITLNYLLLMILFGSGMGWLAGPLGVFTMDFWVAEAYPFLSMLANPHFPLGIGLLLFFFSGIQNSRGIKWFDPFLGVILAIVMPFGVVVGVAVSAVFNLLRLIQREEIFWKLPVAYGLPAGLMLIYQYIAILSDPLLREWNAQNQTPTPSPFVFLISFAPLIFFALVGFGFWLIRDRNSNLTLSAAWLLGGIVLAYIPFALQRRFLLGFFIPVGVFALLGLGRIAGEQANKFLRWFWLIFPLTFLTNLFFLLGAFQAFSQHQYPLYLTKNDQAMLEWMQREVCPTKAVFLTPAEFGLLIPAYTDCRVVYGHPFETVNAKKIETWLAEFYGGKINLEELNRFIIQYQVDYIVWDQSSSTQTPNMIEDMPVIYQNNQYLILRARGNS